jgi:hypothetical protein
MARKSRHPGNFLGRNDRLRFRILEALREGGRLDTNEIANRVYGPRRPRRQRYGTTSPDKWRLAATRRALRHLVAKDKITPTGRYRRRKVFCLARDVEMWNSLSIGPLP